MLFDELQERTNYQCTYEQFQTIEHMYNFCEAMTKDEAASIWKKTYGKEMKRQVNLRKEFEEQLIATREEYMMEDRPEQIQKAIFRAEKELRKINDPWGKMEYTDPLGIKWTVIKWGTTPNGCYTIWQLGFIHNGKFEHVRYNFY